MTDINRRNLLIGGAAAAGVAAAGFGGFELLRKPAPSDSAARGGNKPNVLVVILDQLRTPQWFPQQAQLDALLPNIARLRKASVSFDSHYTASNMCTPSRGVMATGLYSHQTGCLYTFGGPTASTQTLAGEPLSSESTLSPKFPTWGSMLRDQGYRTWWWGKWHLGVDADIAPEALEAHGFSGGTFPSPNGSPGQGLARDPGVVDQFAGWFAEQAGKGPWCTTVSLVNPHDIVHWPRWAEPSDVPHRFAGAPVNFETPDDLVAHNKPVLQGDYQQLGQKLITGTIPLTGDDAQRAWARQLDVYLWLQQQADAQVGRVLETLASKPEVDRNTIVVFTSDHGEYGGSHGLAGKGAAVYEEAIRVPLYIRDPSGRLTPKPGDVRDQLTSSVDLAPLLLTIAAGGDSWRREEKLSHLATRADIAAVARDPSAKGRPWVAHATDDLNVEELGIKVPTAAPAHILSVRTKDAKLAVYSHWRQGGMEIDRDGPIEREFYNYATEAGQHEIENQAGKGDPREAALQALLDHQVTSEVHAPLPARLAQARDEGLADMREVVESREEVGQKMLSRGGH